jgi:phosphatidate cytidylyltransferase
MATTFGLIYVVFLGSYILKIRFQSLEYALLFVCTAKGCDIGAYFTGSALGRHRFHPESPNKTVEGSIGGFVLGTALAVLVTRLFLADSFPLYLSVIYGVLVCAASQIGDLGESMIKRRCGVKDSGKLIPGSGGMLDFADCLLFSAPVAYYFVSFTIT